MQSTTGYISSKSFISRGLYTRGFAIIVLPPGTDPPDPPPRHSPSTAANVCNMHDDALSDLCISLFMLALMYFLCVSSIRFFNIRALLTLLLLQHSLDTLSKTSIDLDLIRLCQKEWRQSSAYRLTWFPNPMSKCP